MAAIRYIFFGSQLIISNFTIPVHIPTASEYRRPKISAKITINTKACTFSGFVKFVRSTSTTLNAPQAKILFVNIVIIVTMLAGLRQIKKP